MKRRKQEEPSPEDDDDDHDEEEPMKLDDEDDDEEEVEGNENEDPSSPNDNDVAFLDTFYGLSSMDPQERAQAAHDMLQHCLLGPQANVKDAAYALKRLLNALCSGRAGARQGNASALVSFIKVATELKQWPALQKERTSSSGNGSDLSHRAFMRQQLMDATSPGEGTTSRGSEERDYQFGRLFGVLAIQKSGLLTEDDDNDDDAEDLLDTSKSLVWDLIELYRYKKWMREPASHAICMMLGHFYAKSDDKSPTIKQISRVLVQDILIPELLSEPDSFTAEQLALALYIQTHATDLPSPLDRPVLSMESIPSLAGPMSETSTVAQPRTHLVWDVLWEYLSKPAESNDDNHKNRHQSRRVMREKIGEESVPELLRAVLQNVVAQRLLGVVPPSEINDDDEMDTTPHMVVGKATHERRALGLCVVRNLLGVEYISSLSGRTELTLTPEMVETIVLEPVLMRRLLVDVLRAGTHGKGRQAAHMLKPFAQQVLNLIVARASKEAELSLPMVRALVRMDARFDQTTKTQSMSTILEYKLNNQFDKAFWDSYIQFLVEKIVEVAQPEVRNESKTSHELSNCLNLLYQAGKLFCKTTNLGLQHQEGESSGQTTNDTSLEVTDKLRSSILSFFVVTAFFDSTSASMPSAETPKTSKKKKKKKSNAAAPPPTSLAVQMALKIKGALPPAVRSVASARFFSLLAEVQNRIQQPSTSKDRDVLKLLTSIRTSCRELQDAGAMAFQQSSSSEAMDEDDAGPSPVSIVQAICARTDKIDESQSSDPKSRFEYSMGNIASVLFLHLLSSGDADDPEDVNADEEEDSEEVQTLLSDVNDIFQELCKTDKLDLTSLSELCTNILSSPLGSGGKNRGASPTLLRDATKLLWSRGLAYAATVSTKISAEAVDLLLQGVGVMKEEDEQMDEPDEAESEDEGDSDNEDTDDASSQADNDENDETKEKKSQSKNDDGGDDDDDDDENDDDDDDEGDLEVDPSKLQSLLEQDLGDDDESVAEELEHHEGADEALAKLIQLKQEARKAGQKAREKLELARHLRCTILLETLLSGKPDGWGIVLTAEALLDTCMALLQYRRILEKSLTKSTVKGGDVTRADKKGLLDRITSILKTKVCKFKLSPNAWSSAEAPSTYAENLASLLGQELRRNDSKDHQQLCSSAIILLTRCLDSIEDKLKVADLYDDVVDEWAHKRTTRVQASFFDQVVQQSPTLAQILLSGKMAEVASTARSPFLKSEAFRLLGMLFNSKVVSNTSLDEVAMIRMKDAVGRVLESIGKALQDDDMKKTKRVRDVIKTTEKVIAYQADIPSSMQKKKLQPVKELLEKQMHDSESQGVKNSCERAIEAIGELMNKETPPAEEMAEEEEKETEQQQEEKATKEIEVGTKESKDEDMAEAPETAETPKEVDDEASDESDGEAGPAKKKKKKKSKSKSKKKKKR